MTREADLARENLIMRTALRQIARNTVNGRPTLSAGVAKGALAEVDKLPNVRVRKVERNVSFIRLPL